MPSYKPMPVDVVAELRYNMMMNLTMTRTDLAKFMNCGLRNASKIWDEIMLDIEKDGKANVGLGKRYVLTERVMKKLGLTRKQIIEDYERTNKKGQVT